MIPTDVVRRREMIFFASHKNEVWKRTKSFRSSPLKKEDYFFVCCAGQEKKAFELQKRHSIFQNDAAKKRSEAA